jgi:hypothetical protein
MIFSELNNTVKQGDDFPGNRDVEPVLLAILPYCFEGSEYLLGRGIGSLIRQSGVAGMSVTTIASGRRSRVPFRRQPAGPERHWSKPVGGGCTVEAQAILRRNLAR